MFENYSKSLTNDRITDNLDYRIWRLAVLERDGRKCVRCSSIKNLHCHHINSWADYPEQRYDVSNGEVLCRSCHIEKHPFMKKFYPKLKIKQKIKHFVIKLTKKERRKLRQERKLKGAVWSAKKIQAAADKERKFSCESKYSKKNFRLNTPHRRYGVGY